MACDFGVSSSLFCKQTHVKQAGLIENNSVHEFHLQSSLLLLRQEGLANRKDIYEHNGTKAQLRGGRDYASRCHCRRAKRAFPKK